MPIEVSTPIKVLSQPEFHAIDEQVMRIIFDVHNEYGRFFDESIYKQAIASRFLSSGLGTAEREGRIRLSYRTFAKDLLVDLLFEHGAIQELKTTETLAPAHRNQTLTYLFLTGLHHARLVNLRPEKVQREFVSTHLTLDARRQLTIADREWRKANSESLWLKETVQDILRDWGAFLDISLYREVIVHLLGGPDRVLTPVPVTIPGISATQRVHLLTQNTAFVFTSLSPPLAGMREHLHRFLRHTSLHYLQRVNFYHHDITFQTLEKAK